jgi:energy-coupling factor transporter transmembrane protein EcfT
MMFCHQIFVLSCFSAYTPYLPRLVFTIFLPSIFVMKLIRSIPLVALCLWLTACNTATTKHSTGFVTVQGTHFAINGKPYYYLGTNFWAGINLGS